MQSTEQGDVALSVTLDTSGLKKETEKIKKEIEAGVKSGNTEIKPQTDMKSVQEVSKSAEEASAEFQKLGDYATILSEKLKTVQEQLAAIKGTVEENSNLYSNLLAEAAKLENTLQAVRSLMGDIKNAGDLQGAANAMAETKDNTTDVAAEMDRLQAILDRNREKAAQLNEELAAQFDNDRVSYVDPKSLQYSEQALEFVKQFGEEAANAQSKTEEATGQAVKQFEGEYARFIEYIQAAEEKASEMAEVIAGLKDVGTDPEELAKMEGEYDALINKIALMRQSIQMGSTAWNEMTPDERYTNFIFKLKSQFEDLGTVIVEKVLPAIKRVIGSFAQLGKQLISTGIKSIGKLVSGFKQLIPQLNKAHGGFRLNLNTILKYVVGVRSLYALFNKFRNAVKEGVRNLAQWRDGNNQVNENLSYLITSLAQLKNQIAAAFAPIINIVVPILNTFVDSLIEAMNYLAQFIAKVTGQTSWIKATRIQKNYAESLKKTGKAAKDAAGNLAGFDDLDILNKKSGADADGGIDPNDMFEEMPIESVEENVEDWIDKLKTAWETGDFTDIGAAIGQRLLEALSDIPWSDIQEKARKLAHSIATLLNGFFETEGLGAKIGETLAQAFRTAFVFVDEFVHTLHWDSIGTFIGESLVSFIKNFPWDEAGHALGGAIVGVITTAYYTVKTFTEQGGWQELINGIITFVQSFLEEMNAVGDDGLNGWQRLGQTLYMTIHGIITSITDLINKLPINDIMDGLGQAADEANGSELINDFMNLGKAIVTAISAVLKKVPWDEVGDAIGEMLNKGIEALPELLDLAGTIVGAIADALFNAVGTVNSEHPITTDIAALIGAAMLAMKASQIAPGAVAAVKDAITYALMGGTGALALGIKVVIAVIVAKIGFDFGKWLGGVLFPDNKPFIQVTIDDLIGSPKDTFNGMKMWFKDIAEGLWETVINPLWSLITGVPSYLIDGLINGWEEEGIVNIDGAMRRMFGPFLDVCNGLIEWVKDIFGIHSPSTVMRDIAINIVEGMINGFNEMTDKVGEVWETIKNKITDVVTLIKDGVMTKIDSFKLTFLGVFVEIQSKIISIWNKIKDGIKTPLNAILSCVETMVNGFITAINKMIEAINRIGNIKVPDWAKNKLGIGDFSINISTLKEISLPRLAQGAVIPPNREFMAVLGDQRQGTNIEAPLDTITEAFADVVGSMRSTGNAVMQLDGQTFARLVVPYVMSELDRRGYNVKVLEG